METRIQRILLSACLMASNLLPTAWAEDTAPEQVIRPEIERREIDPDQIDSEDFEIGFFAGMLSIEDFGTNAVFGGRAMYHVTEDFFIEGVYGTSEAGTTSYENLSGGAQLLADEDRQYSYYSLSVGYNMLPGEAFVWKNYAMTSAFYLIGGAGNTDFAGSTRFTLNFGVGYRLLLNDTFALHVNARDHLFDNDITGESKVTHNFELSTGLSVFF